MSGGVPTWIATTTLSNISGTLAAGKGGTGLSTFGGTNTILYTTAADTLSSETAFTYDPTADRLTATYASTTALTVSGAGGLYVGTLTGMLKGTSGSVGTATAGTDYIAGGVGANTQLAYFTASGVLASDGDLAFTNGNLLTATYASTTVITATTASTTNLTVSALTSGRIPYATTAGAITDDADLAFDGAKLTATYASTTAITSSGTSDFGGVVIGTLTGPLQAISGTVSASSTLSTFYGGTGWSSLQSNTVLIGNGAGRIATTSAGTNGQTLALVNGAPSWVSTTTLSNISGTLAVGKGGT